MEFGRAIHYKIEIESSSNMGFFVKIGCGRFCFENKRNLISALTEFLNKPEEFEKKYNKISGNPQPVVTGNKSENDCSYTRNSPPTGNSARSILRSNDDFDEREK